MDLEGASSAAGDSDGGVMLEWKTGLRCSSQKRDDCRCCLEDGYCANYLLNSLRVGDGQLVECYFFDYYFECRNPFDYLSMDQS